MLHNSVLYYTLINQFEIRTQPINMIHIGPKNIISMLKISNNRICIYLSSKQLVDDFVTEFPEISIAGTRTKVRKLISPAKRIISNVCSSIPHHIIEQALKQTGLKLVSQITTLRAGIAGEERVSEGKFTLPLNQKKQRIYLRPLSSPMKIQPIEYSQHMTRWSASYARKQNILRQNAPTQQKMQCNKKTYPTPATQKSHLKKKHKARTSKKTIKENPQTNEKPKTQKAPSPN
jgi:hypothetical protein